MVERKDFAKAFLFWLFFGGIGAHRFYIRENALVFLWYFPATVCTLGILPLVDIFLLKGMINNKFEDDKARDELATQFKSK